MTLKEFLELHQFPKDLAYKIELFRIDDNGKELYMDYCDNYESPYEEFLRQYFDCPVISFSLSAEGIKVVISLRKETE